MPKFVIEREIPGLGQFGPEKMMQIAQRARAVLRDLGPEIQWLHSHVTENKMYCIFIAPSEAMILEHARRGGFPANRISQITQTIDPTAAEEPEMPTAIAEEVLESELGPPMPVMAASGR